MLEVEGGAEAVLLTSLIVKVARRDQAALERIYRVAAPRLFACALRIVRRRDIAQEIVQDVFLTLWQRASDYEAARGSPLAWLTTITRRKAIDHVRRGAAVRFEDESAGVDTASDTIDPIACLTRAQDEARLVAGLSHLDPERLQMILLAFMFGWSREQIGEYFQRPTGTVKTWLHRTLTELRAQAIAAEAQPPAPQRRIAAAQHASGDGARVEMMA